MSAGPNGLSQTPAGAYEVIRSGHRPVRGGALRHDLPASERPGSGWLGRVAIENPLYRRNAITLQVFALVVSAGCLVIEAGRLANGTALRSPVPSLFNLLTVAVSVGAVLLLRRGYYWQGVFAFVGVICTVFAIRIAFGGIEFSRNILLNMSIPLALAALLLGRRGLWIAFAGYVSALGVATARDHFFLGGHGPQPPPGSVLGLGGFSALILLLLAIVLDRFGLTIRDAFSAAIDRQRELEQRGRDLRRANDALADQMSERDRLESKLREAQKMEAIGRLAGGVAHDFNNLLTVITTNVALSQMEGLSAPLRESLDEIESAARRGAQLTRQLLAFGRRQVIEQRPLDLDAQIESMRTILKRLVGEEIELVFELSGMLPAVLADPGQVEQIVLNLVVNARDAVERHGHIRVATRLESVVADGDDRGVRPHAVLSVQDDGRGMSPEVEAHIFEPFFTTREDTGGTGLGLATVYGLAQQHGGFVRVETREGQGTTFRVYLPLPAVSAIVARPLPDPRTDLARGSGTLLLAEDDAAVRTATTAMLERLGYRVLAARDGAEALELFKQHAAEILALVTDAVMPRMNGRELADRVVALRPGTPVIFLSGYAEDVIVSRGVVPKGVVLVRKPYQPVELADALETALSAGRGAAALRSES